MDQRDFQVLGHRRDSGSFEHSPSYAMLRQSANRGCPLCQVFMTVLKPVEQYSRHQIYPDVMQMTVSLSIQNNPWLDGSILVTCGGGQGWADFGLINEQINAAICGTDPVSQRGNGYERGLTIAKACLDRCDVEHDCQQQEPPNLPTRVIDVGDKHTDPFIYHSDGIKARYTALSYCWDGSGHYKTTVESIKSNTTGMPFDSLPKTIQDAIVITRRLNIKYLWVDALCILQDSHDDFTNEIQRMGDIYSRATLTISAKDAKGCVDGCLPKSKHACPTLLPTNVRFGASSNILSNVYQPPPLALRVMIIPRLFELAVRSRKSVLDGRGWALQEEALSPRVLSCRNDVIIWRCLENEVYEGEIDHQVFKKAGSGSIKSVLARQVDGHGRSVDEAKILKLWFEVVEDFSARCLSEANDKLRALTALQHRFGALLNDTPFMGLWRSQNFYQSLTWTRYSDTEHKLRYSGRLGPWLPIRPGLRLADCPSWSWASTDSAVTYSSMHTAGTQFEMELLSWDLAVVESNVQVTGSITVCSDLFHSTDIVLRETSHHQLCNPPLSKISSTRKQGDTQTQATPDVDTAFYKDFDEVPSVEHSSLTPGVDWRDVWFLVMGTVPFEPAMNASSLYVAGISARVLLMCLTKIPDNGDGEMKFRRIGLAEARNDSNWREKCAKRQVIKLFWVFSYISLQSRSCRRHKHW